MTYTLAITTYNRYEMLLESFAQVIGDDRISEILILDDCSEIDYWNKIKDLGSYNPKIKVIRQMKNRGMAVNKRDAVAYSLNDWVILFDSDNIISSAYLDAIPENLFNDTIYIPDFARPNFDFQAFSGMRINGKVAAKNIKDSVFNMMLNCCNYLVPRDRYVSTFKEDTTVKGSDTIAFAYNWMRNGNWFEVVKGMEYFHRVHKDSGFLADASYNLKKAEFTRKLIMAL